MMSEGFSSFITHHSSLIIYPRPLPGAVVPVLFVCKSGFDNRWFENWS
jgi:hypothetical protein